MFDMEKLRAYLKTLSPDDQARYAQRCGTTIGYLRKRLSVGGRIGESIAIALDRESEGAVPCDSVRPDVDWKYLRGSVKPPSIAANRRD